MVLNQNLDGQNTIIPIRREKTYIYITPVGMDGVCLSYQAVWRTINPSICSLHCFSHRYCSSSSRGKDMRVVGYVKAEWGRISVFVVSVWMLRVALDNGFPWRKMAFKKIVLLKNKGCRPMWFLCFFSRSCFDSGSCWASRTTIGGSLRVITIDSTHYYLSILLLVSIWYLYPTAPPYPTVLYLKNDG